VTELTSDAGVNLSRALRVALAASAVMNLAGAVTFLPFVSRGRDLIGVPDAPGFYLWILSTWVLAFGVAYLHQALTGRGNSAVLGLGAVGKVSFGLALVAAAWDGPRATAALVSAAPDIMLAAWFALWLWQRRQDVHP